MPAHCHFSRMDNCKLSSSQTSLAAGTPQSNPSFSTMQCSVQWHSEMTSGSVFKLCWIHSTRHYHWIECRVIFWNGKSVSLFKPCWLHSTRHYQQSWIAPRCFARVSTAAKEKSAWIWLHQYWPIWFGCTNIVSVHCREEGCIGKYTPRGPKDCGDFAPQGSRDCPRAISRACHTISPLLPVDTKKYIPTVRWILTVLKSILPW